VHNVALAYGNQTRTTARPAEHRLLKFNEVRWCRDAATLKKLLCLVYEASVALASAGLPGPVLDALGKVGVIAGQGGSSFDDGPVLGPNAENVRDPRRSTYAYRPRSATCRPRAIRGVAEFPNCVFEGQIII
jgi:hypothetical protein